MKRKEKNRKSREKKEEERRHETESRKKILTLGRGGKRRGSTGNLGTDPEEEISDEEIPEDVVRTRRLSLSESFLDSVKRGTAKLPFSEDLEDHVYEALKKKFGTGA